jgi:endonuclease/exonuclease/phosphatase family metal-dependent hydrolase
MTRLRVVTWNVHGAVGLDGRRNPARQLAVLKRLAPDCIALQEFVNAPVGDRDLLHHWCESLSMQGRYVANFTRGGREFGIALLTRFPIVRGTEHDISAPGSRRRIALDAVVDTGAGLLHLMAVHCAVRARPRALQRPLIRELTRQRPVGVSVLLGDFNEWRGSCALFTELREDYAGSPPLPTFPAIAPVLPLDRVWVRPAHCLESAHVDGTAPARYASDHLQLVATIVHDGSPEGATGASGSVAGP